MDECLFCKIIKKEFSSNIVYEDETFLVFMDKFPNSPGHMLIVPKKHMIDALEMDDETFKSMNSVIHKMIKLLNNAFSPDGIEIVQNNGICQEIKHYHMHIIPKYKNKINLTNDEIYKILNRKGE